MVNYFHSQFGYAFFIMCGAISVVVFTALYQNRTGLEGVAISFLIMGLILLFFYNLTIKVNHEKITWTFGIGLINKQLEISQVKSTRIVENPWYCGWGIRMMSEGTLYNISGFQAVNLELKDGTHIRLGTDEPQQLKAAIDAHMSEKSGEK